MNDLVKQLRGPIKHPEGATTLKGAAADEIERLEQEVSLYKASDEMLNECCQELAMFKDAVEHCIDPNYIKRSTSSSDGWTMISSEFYFDLMVAYDDTVRKEYRKQVLLEAAAIDWWDKDVAAELRRMAEEL